MAPDSTLSGYPLRGKQGKIIRSLGTAIVRGQHPPGSVLPTEMQLLKRFSVSRTSLREAIKVLTAKGLLESVQRIGTRVRAKDCWDMFDPDVLSWHDISIANEDLLHELMEVRLIIEPIAARLAAERATPRDLRVMARTVTAMRASIDDPKAYEHADALFHKAVFAATHNRFLMRFFEVIYKFLEVSFRLLQDYAIHNAEERERDCVDHEAISSAIQARTKPAAEELMRKVVVSAKEALELALISGLKNANAPK